MSWKQTALDAAEVVDAWRLIPRGIVAGYGFMLYQTGAWFMSLEIPSGAQSAYVSILWGAFAAVSGLYFNSGRKWR
jgi:hypothetical protein